jgi:gliding motility-associated-like protein
LIGTNSAITFDITRAGSGSGYSISNTTGSIPNTAYAPNMIFGPYHDIDIDYADASTNSKIEYRIEGTAPNRRLIASYSNIPYFSCGTSMFATHQMVLYESTGIIEVYIKDKPVCSTWNSGLAILGLQGTGSQAVTVPGYNATVWGSTGMDTAFRFTPSGGVTRFKSAQLLVNGNVVNTGDTSTAGAAPGSMNLNFGNVCPSADSTAYVLKLTYGRCNDVSQDVSFYDTIYVKKLTPTFTLSQVNSNCSGGCSISASVVGGSGVFQYSLNGGAFQTSNTFNNLPAGNYVVTIQNANNCSFSQSATLTLTNNLSVSALPTDTSICVGASFTPRVTSAGTAYVWNGPGTFSSATVAQPVITPSTNGSFIVSSTQGPCTRKDTINVTLFPGPQINAGPDLSVINGDFVQLQATAGAGTYLWTPPTGLSASNILNPMAGPNQTTTYTLTATSPQGCTSSDQVEVTVLNCFDPQNAFTPNGDGINDVWLVNLGACLVKAKVEVFNRYGAKVFESNEYKNNWDGTYKGKNLPDGTYYYVLTVELIGGKKIYYKGNVTILR